MIAFRRFGRIAAAVALLSLAASAADLAQLRNGFSIRHERREVMGSITRLYLGPDSAGYVDVATADIVAYEHDDTPAPVRAVAVAKAPLVQTAPDYADLVQQASERTQIDPAFIRSVIRAESAFNPRAVSPKGAVGLMQLMPGTATQLGVTNPLEPAANVDGGTRYLRQLLLQYHGDAIKALAAYNAGAARVDRYHGVPPFHETHAYVTRIINDYNRQKLAQDPTLRSAAKRGPASHSASARATSAHPGAIAGAN